MTIEELRKCTKAQLIDHITYRDVVLGNMNRELNAAKQSYQELEKVQQAVVARLERAYEAVVAATLDRRAP